jgi:hypothetical protein
VVSENYVSLTNKWKELLSRLEATLSPPCGERAGRGVSLIIFDVAWLSANVGGIEFLQDCFRI